MVGYKMRMIRNISRDAAFVESKNAAMLCYDVCSVIHCKRREQIPWSVWEEKHFSRLVNEKKSPQ